MSYYIKGNLRGYLCEDCLENLNRVTVLLYLPQSDANNADAGAADTGETFRFVNEKEKKARKKLLLAQALTDEMGNFELEIQNQLPGRAFDLDIVCRTVSGKSQQTPEDKAYQFHLTTIYPEWQSDEKQNFYYPWQYIVSARWWCTIRGRFFDAWVICGRLVDCQTGAALAGVTVKALDADLITDDLLGSAVTDAGGYFRINYTSADFKKTFLSPALNLETDILSPFVSSGPDVYFNLEFSGTPIVFETATNRRNNVDYCLCVQLCVENIQIPDPTIPASFTHIGRAGRIKIVDEINPATGKTQRPGFDNYAFYSSVILVGSLAKKLNGLPMEYKFEYQELSSPGSPVLPGGWLPVTPDMIGKTIIGYLWTLTGDPLNPVITENYYINGIPATENTVDIVDNWIRMPQNANFAPHIDTDILVLHTEKLMPVVNIDVNAMTIGNATIPGVAAHVANRYFALRMKQRQWGNAATEVVAGTSRAIAVFNARYHNVPKHGSWVPTKVNNQMAVGSLDILELASGAGGCSKITNALHVKYNARNENLGGVSLLMTGPAKPGQTFSFPAIPAVTPEVFGNTSPVIAPVNAVTELLACAYTIFLSASVLLTTGDGSPDPVQDFISFTKE